MSSFPAQPTSLQVMAAVTVSSMLFFCAVIVLRDLIPSLLWAVVLAIALWPVYSWTARWHRSTVWRRLGAPLIFTFVLGIVIAVPLGFGAVELGHSAEAFVKWALNARREGVPVPDSIMHVPYVGGAFATWWKVNLSDPEALASLMEQVEPQQLVGWSRAIGGRIIHDLIIFVFTLLALFFLFRDGETLRDRFSTFVVRVFGERGQTISEHAVTAVDGTLIGLVLVGLAEGSLIGLGYWIAGVPHTFLFAVATAVLAIIPMGAPLAFTAAATLLYIQGDAVAAAGIFVFGTLVVMLADCLVRPILIGSTARLPFLLVLLGTLGGISTLGIIGLFVGPVLMAVLVALWRDLSELDARTPIPAE